MILEAQKSPLLKLMDDYDMLEFVDLCEDDISKVFLFEEDTERTFTIPFFCQCVMDSFLEKEPIFSYDNPIIKNIDFIYDLLKKSFNHSRLVCSCYEDNFSVYNGFYLHEIEESSIKEWVDHGPILIKNPCAYCAGEGESITEINKTCDLCSGHGYTADTIKKDASLCEQCGGFGIFKERNARSCESCSGIGFKPAVYSLEYADVQAPYDEFLEYGKYDNLDRTQICCIACPSCDRGYEYSTIIHNKKYTPKEWRSISLVQRGLLKFENFDIDTGYEIYTLKKLRDEFPHCQLLNKLMDISLSEDSIFTFKARYTPALNEGDISAVHLDVKLQIICDRCLGCDTLGIPYPGTESLHTEYGTPAAGTIRLFRSKRMK